MMKLLVLDDSELIRSRLVAMLQGIPGVDEITTADTLAKTLLCVQACAPTLAILDLHLPDGNACQLIPTLKRIVPDMKVIVLTNDGGDFSRDRCLQAGADWFFDKSTEFEKVLDLLHTQAAVH